MAFYEANGITILQSLQLANFDAKCIPNYIANYDANKLSITNRRTCHQSTDYKSFDFSYTDRITFH